MTQNVIVNARITFHDSPIHILEKFLFKDTKHALQEFTKQADLRECVIIQTCNRVEMFVCADNYKIEEIKKTWSLLTGMPKDEFKKNLKIEYDDKAYNHLLQLVSGLDSMVLGEEQILGQIKNSITMSRTMKISGERLNTLFDRAIRIGTRIRNTTGIGQGGVSVGSMALKLAEENIDDLRAKQILLIGTGEVSTLVAKSLIRRGYSFYVTSRTMQRAEIFCRSLGGTPIKFEDVLNGFKNYDLVFVATVTPYSLVTFDRIKQAMKERRTEGMMILDLSNPRTVDEKVVTLRGVKLMNLDQIAELVDKNMRNRRAKVNTIKDIINEEVPIIKLAMKRLDVEPAIKNIFKVIDEIREKEVDRALQMLKESDERKIKIINELTKEIVERIISTPMNNLRKASEQDMLDIVDTANKLFDYDDNDATKKIKEMNRK